MGLLRISVVVTSVLPWLAVSGCASQNTETRRQMQRLNEQVAILQNERDRLDERVAALEAQQQVLLEARKPKADAARPALELVRLQPTAADPGPGPRSPVAPEPSDDESSGRVLISGTGNKLTATEIAAEAP